MLSVSLSWISVPILTFFITPARADPPVLYSNPAYESPVRGDPDDLLLIPGIGLSAADSVVYRAVSDTTSPSPPPNSKPTQTTAALGVADLVSSADAPYSLTIHLPSQMTRDQSYALWVMTPDNQWSKPVLINDARPLWITPDSAYQTASLASLPRLLKVVGRNLQPDSAAGATTQVRLVGQSTGATYTLTAKNTSNDAGNTTAALERYVAAVNLPSTLVVDQYAVLVSRDGTSWVPLLGNGQSPAQTLTVKADPILPSPATTFDVSDPRYADPVTGNACHPDDGIDDTGCIIAAIRAAQTAGGGTVTFGRGTWLMTNAGTWVGGLGYSNRIGFQPGHYCPGRVETCGVSYYGLLVPVHISLQGAGATGTNPTIIERGTGWPAGMPGFTLQGRNVVTGIEFTDDNNYTDSYPAGNTGGPQLQLGLIWYFALLYDQNDPVTVSNVAIYNNVFIRNARAITNGDLPADHIYITNNTFGGIWDTAIATFYDENVAWNLGPTPRFPYQAYQFADAIVSHNTFYPSGYTTTAGGGPIATNLNGSVRLDFSDNIADGAATQYLNAGDPPGWRAAFFWNPATAHDMTLVSNNTASCTGDKNGDGEFIAYDTTGTLGGMPYAEPIVAATAWTNPQGTAGTTVVAQGSVVTQLKTNQSSTPVDISADPSPYYKSFWLHIVKGTGKGQWRRVESVVVGTNAAGPTVTLNVTPAFDVMPDAGSEVILGRGYWQNATVNNYVDQRTPKCTKNNARRTGGVITWYASTADSAIEGNQQYDTSGIFLRHVYQPEIQTGDTPPVAGLSLQSSNEVRNNLVSGTYAFSNATNALGGIGGGYGATAYFCSAGNCTPAPVPPNTGFGISIAGNTIIQADTRDGITSSHEPAVGPTLSPGIAAQAIYYAKNIVASAANTVTVTFSDAVLYPDVRVAEYSGLDRDNPVDVSVGASGSGMLADSGAVTTTTANDLLVAADYIANFTANAGADYTLRIISAGSNLLEDKVVSSVGVYGATASQSYSDWWIMQMVAFRMASTGNAPP